MPSLAACLPSTCFTITLACPAPTAPAGRRRSRDAATIWRGRLDAGARFRGRGDAHRPAGRIAPSFCCRCWRAQDAGDADERLRAARDFRRRVKGRMAGRAMYMRRCRLYQDIRAHEIKRRVLPTTVGRRRKTILRDVVGDFDDFCRERYG